MRLDELKNLVELLESDYCNVDLRVSFSVKDNIWPKLKRVQDQFFVVIEDSPWDACEMVVVNKKEFK